MLDRARHADDGEPLFLVKGGVAMELRVEAGARATKDFDTAVRAEMDAVTAYLNPALRAGHGDFTATRTELEPVGDTGAARCDIKLAYRGKSVVTVKLEVSAAEAGVRAEIDHVPAKSLDHVGLTRPETVPCVAVRWQIAQQLHACTEAFDQRENDRFRDLLDLQLLAELVDDDEWESVRDACVEVFDGRAKHEWPPRITIPESWVTGYKALAVETGFSVTDVREAAERVGDLVARIDHGGS